MTRYLILAAGSGYRWHDYLGIRKHQLPLDGETILERTARQLADHGEVVVVAPDLDAYRVADLYVPPRIEITGAQIDKFLSSREAWSEEGPTVFLWGDVRWTDEAIASLTAYEGLEWNAWYRPGVSRLTGTGNGEMFAVLFHPHEHGAVEAACERVLELHRRELIPWSNTGGWSFYRALLGLPDDQVNGWHDGRHATLIDDWTDDFDGPGDYRTWYGRRAAGRYRVAAEPWAWDLPASEDPEVIVHVRGEGRIPDDSLWCAVAHAAEWGESVIPYSHHCPEGQRWEARPLHTAVRDARLVVTPAGKAPGLRRDATRLLGPLFT